MREGFDQKGPRGEGTKGLDEFSQRCGEAKVTFRFQNIQRDRGSLSSRLWLCMIPIQDLPLGRNESIERSKRIAALCNEFNVF